MSSDLDGDGALFAPPAITDGIRRRRAGSGWSYKIDGLNAPGVTKILGMLPKDSLIKWSAEATAAYAVNNWATLGAMPPADRLKVLFGSRFEKSGPAALRGTAIHAAGAALAVGRDADYPAEHAGYVESYRDWLDTLGVAVPFPPELIIANRTVRYCGTLDVIGDLPALPWEGETIPAARWLIDVKTARTGIWPETALQLAGYKNAEVFIGEDGTERPMSWLEIDRAGALWIRADGWDFYPVDTGPDVWATFKYLAWLYHHEEDRREWIGAAAGPVRPAPDPAGVLA
jgi:hypothetical protein